MRTAIAAVLLLTAGVASHSGWAEESESRERPRLEEYSALSVPPANSERERKAPDSSQIHAGTEYATGLSLQGPPRKPTPGAALELESLVDF